MTEENAKRKQYAYKLVIQQQPDSTNFGSAKEWAEHLKFVLDQHTTLADIVSVEPIPNCKRKK